MKKSLRQSLNKRKLVSLCLFSSFVSFTQASYAEPLCQSIFTGKSTISLSRESLRTTLQSFARLKFQVEIAKVGGSLSLGQSTLKHDVDLKEMELEAKVAKSGSISMSEARQIIKNEIERLQAQPKDNVQAQEEQAREEQRRSIKEALNPRTWANTMAFHEIRPGHFNMGADKIPTEITKPFAMMATHVTQYMWARLKVAMGEADPAKINPSLWKNDGKETTVNIEGIEVMMNPAHPVEQVSWDDVTGAGGFIEGLNKLSNSNDAGIQELLQDMIPGHQKGDHYDLPTEAQWEFVMQDRGNQSKKHFDRDDDSELDQYAWTADNTNRKTHAVAGKKPRMIDGQAFYDLEGNVAEWTRDLLGRLKGGQDPLGPTAAEGPRIVRGGSVESVSAELDLSIGIRPSKASDTRLSSIGFRLIRTRP